MGFEFGFNEDTLLRVSGISALGYCAFAVAAPKDFHATFMSKTATLSEPAWRYMGIAGGMAATDHLVLSTKGLEAQAVKKDVLKVAGWGWLALAANNAYNIHNGSQPKQIAGANVVGQALLATACLWKGYE